MKLPLSVLGHVVRSAPALKVAARMAARIEPGQMIELIDGQRLRVLAKKASPDGFRIQVLTAGGKKTITAEQLAEMSPVTAGMRRLAAFVLLAGSGLDALDDYVKEAIKAAGYPVDKRMNWTKYLDRMYMPLVAGYTRDQSVIDDAILDVVVNELYDKRILASDSLYAHFDPENEALRDRPVDERVTAYLVMVFKARKSLVIDKIRRTLGAGSGGSAGLSPAITLDAPRPREGDDNSETPGYLRREDLLNRGEGNPDINLLESEDEVREFLEAFKAYILGMTQDGKFKENTAKGLNFITDCFAQGDTKRRIREQITNNTDFQGRLKKPLDVHGFNYLMEKWGQLIRDFAQNPEQGWSNSPVARMIQIMTLKEQQAEKGQAKAKATVSALRLAYPMQDQPPAPGQTVHPAPPSQPNVQQQQNARPAAPPATPAPAQPAPAQPATAQPATAQPVQQNDATNNNSQPPANQPKRTIPPELPGVNHTASEKTMKKEQKNTKAEPKIAARTKFAALVSIASEEPQEVGLALDELGASFTALADKLEALKTNLDLVEAPTEASIREKVASRNKYARTLRRIASEQPEELAAALNEFYAELDSVVSGVENLAENLGVTLSSEDASKPAVDEESTDEIPEELAA